MTPQPRKSRTRDSSSETIRLLFHHHPIPMWVYDIKTLTFLDVNHAAIDTYGYTRDEFLTMTLKDIRPAEDVDQLVSNVVRERPTFQRSGEWRHRYKDGRVVDVEITSHTLEYDGRKAVLVMAQDISERKRAQEAVQDSELQYRRILDSMLEGCQIIDFNWRYVYVNDVLTQQGKRSREELLGRTMMEMYPGIEHTEVFAALKRCMQERIPRRMENRFEFPDGSVGWFELSIQPAREGIFILSTDITERKRAEEHIRKLNRVYAVLSNINQAIVRIHEPQRLFEEACRIAIDEGQFRLAWIGKLDADTGQVEVVASAGDAVPYLNGIDINVRSKERSTGPTGRAIATRVHMVSNDIAHDPAMYSWRDYAASFNLRSTAAFPIIISGTIWGAFTLYSDETGFFDLAEIKLLDEMATDISFAIEFIQQEAEQRRVEEELLQSEQLFRQLTENIHEVFWLTDAARTSVLYISPAYESIWGRNCVDLLASPRHWLEAVHPDDRERVAHAATRQATGAYDEEYRIVRPDGSVRWIRDRAFPVHNAAGEVYRIAGVAEDITERKHAEDTRRMLEAQLYQAQKLEGLGTLASGIAHDFNNILGIIIGHASLLDETATDPAAIRKNAEAITKAGIRGAQLVKQMLTFARKGDVKFESVSLNEIVSDVAGFVRETFPKTITMSLDLGDNLPSVSADATQVYQVMLNLCVNARDAMPDGGVLTISTRTAASDELYDHYPRPTAPEYVLLSVADTGTGMDAETQRRAFEPFFTTKEQGKGTGLGLSLVFGIMENHKGLVTVESEVGKGTTFRCFFPALSGTTTTAQVAERNLEDIPGGNETLLVVEDEEMLRELVKAFLESKGYTVLTAEDGEQGLGVFQRHRASIALVISDLGLPKFGGEELYRRLAALNPQVRMILASGYFEPDRKTKASREGILGFIQKPYNPVELLHTIHKVLRREEQR